MNPILFLDIFSGISGDMFIGAMLDLGVGPKVLGRELEKLGLKGYHIDISRQERGAISGTKFDVLLDSVAKSPAHHHDHHTHDDDHPSHFISHTQHHHSHSAHPSHFTPLPSFDAPHTSHLTPHTSHHTSFTEIRQLITASGLSPWVKEKAVAVFERVAAAEGRIHGKPPEQVHFHEVGAIDSIVDIVGACLCLEALGKPRVLAANAVEGTGTIRCAHGTFPIPAPATLEILRARGVTLQQCDEPGELITPTGAALLAEFAESFGPLPAMAIEKVGYGLGTRQNKTRPNVLRAVLGASQLADRSAYDWETDTIAILETNLDDINAEVLGAFVEKALAAGALDVFHVPVQMKKNRPGVLLTVLSTLADADRFAELMLRETTAFGVRRTSAERRKLKREIVSVKTKFGDVAVKLGRLNGGIIQASPEFESCREISEVANVPVRLVYDAVIKALKL